MKDKFIIPILTYIGDIFIKSLTVKSALLLYHSKFYISDIFERKLQYDIIKWISADIDDVELAVKINLSIIEIFNIYHRCDLLTIDILQTIIPTNISDTELWTYRHLLELGHENNEKSDDYIRQHYHIVMTKILDGFNNNQPELVTTKY